MKKLKSPRHVLLVLIVVFYSGLGFSKDWVLSPGKGFSGGFQERYFKILVIDCKSSIFSELYDSVNNFFAQESVPYTVIKRRYDNLEDFIETKLQDIDLFIISGSSAFFPDSPEVKDVAALLKISIEQNKHAFGICFGLQLLAHLLDPEDGKLIKSGSWDEDVSIQILKADPIFKGVGKQGDLFTTRQYHKYSVPYRGSENMDGGSILAKSKDGIEIIKIGNVVASQFHPESRYASQEAISIFQNYLRESLLSYKRKIQKVLRCYLFSGGRVREFDS